MRRLTGLLVLSMTFGGLAVGAELQSPAQAGFEKLKTLVGSWEGQTTDGRPVTVSYKLVSAGSALVETIGPGVEPEMVTVYHQDGGRLLLTHYCAAQNQPRMASTPSAGDIRELTFSFLDATNLAGPDAGHMHKVVLTFDDGNHITQQWTWREKGQEKVETFRLARKN